MKVENQIIGANGEYGVTVYKSIENRVLEIIKMMLNEKDLKVIDFESYDNQYSIEKTIDGCFEVTKVNSKMKIFKYIIVGIKYYDTLFSIKYPMELNGIKKYKMRMYENELPS